MFAGLIGKHVIYPHLADPSYSNMLLLREWRDSKQISVGKADHLYIQSQVIILLNSDSFAVIMLGVSSAQFAH